MNQDERNAKNVADLAKLQAVKETTERFLHLGEESAHSLIMFEWLDEQEVSTAPLESFLSFQNNLLLAGETLDFAMSERKMTQKEIEELADKLFDKNISKRLDSICERKGK